MFYDVEHSRAVRGNSAKPDSKHLVLIGVLKEKELGSRFLVNKNLNVTGKLFDPPSALFRKTV
jgi:hypothetical protein